ncbi:C39 family peptidase [Succiniclasticum ruminis]|uniref:Papain-like cysteine protease AvrRpt2 n=1 Tax=Succiniclasticum ruminis DSM 9236 TaxID=1123323 RepID=A0A1I1XBY7_9FIRM|nr:C39 family peptidase [Succiniclasticum ruminis]SFE04914.1 Papain-like cysteine protease AvrRpt2 [Succiniclasticum ruminis DSM 9236]
MKKSAVLLAAALIAVAVFNFYTGTKHTGNAEQSGVLDEITTKMVLLLQKDGGGPASVQGQSDVKDSPYFKKVDVYNMKSGGSLLLLEKYKTHQQHTYYTCGPAAALTVVQHFLGKTPDSEMEMAKIMGTHPAGVKDPGTNTRGMSRYFEQKGWKVKNALKDGSPETYEKFLVFVDDNLKRGIPIMVENVDWGGHWRVIIGLDTLGDKNEMNDVLILADPYDTTDHAQDGYNIISATRFYYMWFDASLFREKEKVRQWLTAVPPDYKGL